MGMDFDMNDALRLIGRQQIEITVLRERVALLQAHQCPPPAEPASEDRPSARKPKAAE